MGVRGILGISAFAAQLGFASLAFGQTFSIEEVGVVVGSSQVTVDWSLDADGAALEGYGIDITFDDSIVTPVTDGGTPNAVVDCIAADGGASTSECNLLASGDVIRISAVNFTGVLGDANGSITFDIDPGAEAGDSSPLTVSIADAQPEGVTIEFTSGSIEITAGPQPAATFNPDSGETVPFGTQIVNTTSDPEEILVCNTEGDEGSTLTGISASVAGGSTVFGVNDSDCSDGVAQGDCCSVSVSFTPDALEGFSETLEVSTADVDATYTLTGTGTEGPQSSLSISDDIVFGTVDIGDMPVGQGFTVTVGGDAGADPVEITSVELSSGSSFEIGTDGCSGETLPVGASCGIEILFEVESPGGPFNDTVTVESTADNNATVTGGISGSAIAVPNVTVNPASGTDVNLSGGPGDKPEATPVWSNTGSADASITCLLDGQVMVGEQERGLARITLVGDTTFTLESGAEGEEPFSIQCDLTDAEIGDEFDATMRCEDTRPLEAVGEGRDNGFSSTHDITCSAVDPTPPLPVPTMSNWSIALFAMLMLLVGGISIRFFRV